MTKTKLIAAATVVALFTPISATAGSVEEPVEETVIIALPDNDAGSLRGSLGGPVGIGLASLLVLGALAAAGGS